MTIVSRTMAIGIAATAALLVALAGSALARDGNNDRIPDRWEKKNDLSLKVKQTRKDQDRDGLRNLNEWRAGTDPHDADTDDDGIDDRDENAGTVESFDAQTGQLTIDPFQGDPISGLVTADTEISCENEDHPQAMHESESDNSGPGSENSGPGSDDGPGDDEDEDACTTVDLVPGAVVHEAELEVTSQGGVFEEIELVR